MIKQLTRTARRLVSSKARLALLSAFIVTLLGGCATNVQVVATFPKPIVNQLPYTIGVYYPTEFSQYQYTEANEERSDMTIGMGTAQVSLFNTVLPALFKQTVRVNQAENPQTPTPVDLVITMSVDDFQYTIPAETRIDMYEVWVKYNLQLFDPQGQLIADWLLTAYGKTPSEMMKSESEAINQAMIVALRDAGAKFTITFNKVPEVRQWLEQRQKSQI